MWLEPRGRRRASRVAADGARQGMIYVKGCGGGPGPGASTEKGRWRNCIGLPRWRRCCTRDSSIAVSPKGQACRLLLDRGVPAVRIARGGISHGMGVEQASSLLGTQASLGSNFLARLPFLMVDIVCRHMSHG